MAHIKIDWPAPPVDGAEVKFKAPCDSSQVEGLLLSYVDAAGAEASKSFAFRDSSGDVLNGHGGLFCSGALVKVTLDVTKGYAYFPPAGAVTRAKLAQDALYSPVVTLSSGKKDHAISASDIGKTIYTHSGSGNSYTVTLDAAADASIPVGAEIAICYFFGDSLTVTMNGVKVYHSEIANGNSNFSFRIPERYSMIALKKILVASNTGYWLVTGNVEAVS